jgi:hypothetical protein
LIDAKSPLAVRRDKTFMSAMRSPLVTKTYGSLEQLTGSPWPLIIKPVAEVWTLPDWWQ